MFNTRKLFPITFIRSIHITNINNGIELTMRKIMKHPKKKKPFYAEQPMLPHPNSFGKDLLAPKTKVGKRRVNVLNKLFMRHITDLMTTSELSPVYVGLGLEINKVEVAPDYNGVNVFWVAKTSTEEADIADMLNRASKQLRHELTQLRVIGVVPKIHFIKDKQYAEIAEVDNRLAKADFGEDYEPPEAIQRLKTKLMINTTLGPDLRERIRKLEESFPEEVQVDVPEMPQDVLGLNHKYIMDRIRTSINRSSNKQNTGTFDNSLVRTVNTQPVEFKTVKMQREAFRQFLMERQILKRKIRRANAEQRPDLVYFENEYVELRERELDSLQPAIVEENDYIEEDVDDTELNDK